MMNRFDAHQKVLAADRRESLFFGTQASRRLSQALLLSFVLLMVLAPRAVHAADDETDDDASRATHAAAGVKSLRRQYLGGRDEEELTVQAALPQPVRSPEGVPATPETGAGAHD